jgi:hypothetical protein
VISRQQYINKLRELDYTFKRQAKRVDLWRKRGGTHYIAVPQTDRLEDEFVTSSLRQAGRSPEEIHAFLAACKS